MRHFLLTSCRPPQLSFPLNIVISLIFNSSVGYLVQWIAKWNALIGFSHHRLQSLDPCANIQTDSLSHTFSNCSKSEVASYVKHEFLAQFLMFFPVVSFCHFFFPLGWRNVCLPEHVINVLQLIIQSIYCLEFIPFNWVYSLRF